MRLSFSLLTLLLSRRTTRDQPRREFFYVGGEYVNITVGLNFLRQSYTNIVGRKFNCSVHDQPDLC